MYFPPGDQARVSTGCVWPVYVNESFPVVAERTCTECTRVPLLARSLLPAATLLPSGDHANAPESLVSSCWLKEMGLGSPVAILQMFTVSLSNAAAILLPSGDHARASTL